MIFVRIFAFPPVVWSKGFSHTRHFTVVVEHPNTTISLPHSRHLTFKNRDWGSGTSIFLVIKHSLLDLVFLNAHGASMPDFLTDRTGIKRERAFIQFSILVEDGFTLGSIPSLFFIVPAPPCGHFSTFFSFLIDGNLHGLVSLAVRAIAFDFLRYIHFKLPVEGRFFKECKIALWSAINIFCHNL